MISVFNRSHFNHTISDVFHFCSISILCFLWHDHKETKSGQVHCTRLLCSEVALKEERKDFLGGGGEEGGEREEGDVEVEAGEESGEAERLLVGLLLGEPRGDEYGDRACSIRPLRSWMAC